MSLHELKTLASEKKKKLERTIFGDTIFLASFITSVTLIVAGFYVPPTGIIDGSVLTAVGELAIFPISFYVTFAIRAGHGVKVSKGDTTIEVQDNDDQQPEQETE